MARRREGAAQVHPDDGVPLLDRHVDHHPVTQDAGVVDQDVEPAEGVDGRLDQPPGAVVVRDVVAVGHGFAAHAPDLVDHLTGRSGRAPGPVDLGPEVVHHDLGALAGELEGVLPPDAPARPGDDDDASVADAHDVRSLSRISRMSRMLVCLGLISISDRSAAAPCRRSILVPQQPLVDLPRILARQLRRRNPPCAGT